MSDISKNTSLTIVIIVALAACLTSVSSDIYAPSLLAITEDLKAPLNEVQWSMSVFMIGVFLSQLFYGPLSEGYGRKPLLMVGLIISLIGTYICLEASSISFLLVGRFIQGIGNGSGASLWRSIFRDSLKGTDLSKYGSYLSIVLVFIVAIAPSLGGFLQEHFGWRSIFVFLMGYSLVSLFLVLVLFKETNSHRHKDRLNRAFFKDAMMTLLKSPIFMGYSLGVFFCYGALFSWFIVGPAIVMEGCHFSPQEFGWMSSVIGGVAMLIGGLLNGRLVKIYGALPLLKFGLITMIVSGLLMNLGYVLFGQTPVAIGIPLFIFILGSTFVWPNAFAEAFTPFGKIAGYAGALYSFIQLSGAGILGSIVAFLPDTNQLPLGLVFTLLPFFSWIIIKRIPKS